jgi:hypothetical protein
VAVAAVVGAAFAAGLATAPDDAEHAAAPAASAPRSIEVPPLERTAALPALRVEEPVAAAPADGGSPTDTGAPASTGGGVAVTPAPAPAPTPAPAPAPAPAPTGGGGGGGDPVVGDGL